MNSEKKDQAVMVLLTASDLKRLDEVIAGTEFKRGPFVRACLRDALRKIHAPSRAEAEQAQRWLDEHAPGWPTSG